MFWHRDEMYCPHCGTVAVPEREIAALSCWAWRCSSSSSFPASSTASGNSLPATTPARCAAWTDCCLWIHHEPAHISAGGSSINSNPGCASSSNSSSWIGSGSSGSESNHRDRPSIRPLWLGSGSEPNVSAASLLKASHKFVPLTVSCWPFAIIPCSLRPDVPAPRLPPSPRLACGTCTSSAAARSPDIFDAHRPLQRPPCIVNQVGHHCRLPQPLAALALGSGVQHYPEFPRREPEELLRREPTAVNGLDNGLPPVPLGPASPGSSGPSSSFFFAVS